MNIVLIKYPLHKGTFIRFQFGKSKEAIIHGKNSEAIFLGGSS